MDQGKMCPKCGSQCSMVTKFCENCGFQFPVDVAGATAADATQAVAGGAGFGAGVGLTPDPTGAVQGGYAQAATDLTQGGYAQAATGLAQGGYAQAATDLTQGSYGQAPTGAAQGGYGQAPTGAAQGGYGQAPTGAAQGGYGQAPTGAAPGGFGQAPQGAAPGGFGQAPQGAYANPATQMQLQQPKKTGGGVIAAIIAVIVLLVGGIIAAVVALGGSGGKADSIKASTKRVTIEVGEEAPIDITNYDELGKVVLEYSVDDKSVAKISEEFDDGLTVRGVAAGTTTITISGGKYEDVTVKVTVEEPATPDDGRTDVTTDPDDGRTDVTTDPDDGRTDVTTDPDDGRTDVTTDPDPVQTVGMPDELDENADGSLNLWCQYNDEIVGKVYVVDGYTLDRVYSSARTVFCDSDTLSGIYYSCYSEMPVDEWGYVEYSVTPDDSDDFTMDIYPLDLSCDGHDLYYAYRHNSANEYGEYDMYYIFYEYSYRQDGSTYYDCVTIELYPEQAEDWDKSDYQDFARAVFGL